MPMVNDCELCEPMFAVQLQVAVPVVVSPAAMRPTRAAQRKAPVSRFMNITAALRISPGSVSPAASGVTLMSWTVALKATIAVLEVAPEVEEKRTPVYVRRASSRAMVSVVAACETRKLASTPPNTAVAACAPGAIWPVGGVPGGDGSRSATVSVPARAPAPSGASGAAPILWLPTKKVTLVAGARPLTFAGESVAVKVTRSLYWLGFGVTLKME